MTAQTETAIVEVSRHIKAAPERVFDAWLDPAMRPLMAVRAPRTASWSAARSTPRVGGRFTIVERRGDDLAEHFGEYVEIDRPRRLAFDFWTSFSDERTRVTVTYRSRRRRRASHPHPRGRLGGLRGSHPPGLGDDP